MMSVILNHLYGPHLYGQLTYPYELVGFFFVAGYTFHPKDSFRAFLLGKMRTLIVPILLLGLINVLLSWGMKGGSLFLRIEGLLFQRPGLWDDLWFVACLFTMEMMFYLIVNLNTSLFVQGMVCLAFMFMGHVCIDKWNFMLPWHIENACVLIIFLFLGYALRQTKWRMQIESLVHQSKGRVSLLAILVAYVFLALSIKNYPIDIHLHQYGTFVIFMLSAFLGLCVVVGLSWIMERHQHFRILRFLSYIGANTLVYYAFQSKVISLLKLASPVEGLELSSYVGSLVCCMVACVLLILPSFLIKRYVPFLLGRFHTDK